MAEDRVVYRDDGARCRRCKGELTFCWALTPSGGRRTRIWCAVCRLIRNTNVTKAIRNGYGLNDKNLPQYKTHTKATRPRKQPSVIPQAEAIPEEVKRLRAMPYADYLQTPHWKQIRAMALHQANYRCQLCNGKEKLQVHHRTYERLGCEWLEDLTVLCRGCHELFHQSRKKD